MSSRVESRDRGANALLRTLKSIAPLTLNVGILEKGGDDHGNGLTVADVATFHEFGTATIPERSFIRAWYDESFTANKAAMRAVLAGVTRGQYTLRQAFEQLGSLFVAQIQARIVAHIPPPLAESTIKAKGSSTPLIDTGQLKSSITYQVTP